MFFRTIVPHALLALALAGAPASAQQPPVVPPARPPQPPPPPPSKAGITAPGAAVSGVEISAVSHAWSLLSQGLFLEAASRGAELLKTFPNSAAVLTLAVEARVAAEGSNAALDQYEQWIGARRHEEPAVLRRLAVAILREQARNTESAGRPEALRSLAGGGDEVAPGPLPGDRLATRALAEGGNEAAVAAVIAELNAGAADAMTAIQVLGKSGSRLAFAPLLERLKDARPEVRGTAAQAVAGLGGAGRKEEIVGRLRPLLSDESSFVRVRAAGALFSLGDGAGAPVLSELISNESAPTRLIAAEALASRPDTSWVQLVRGLVTAPEPEVRIRAAQLIAPHDPDLARATLEQLSSDPNLAIQEAAARALPETTTDLRRLRTVLRSSDPIARVKAAGRILLLTQ